MNQKNNTTETIINAATQAFAESGFAGARMDDIARRAGVNKATIYYNIGNKDALYYAVLLSIFEVSITRMAVEIQKTDSPEEQLRLFIHAFADAVDANPSLPNIIMWEHASGGKNMPEAIAGQIAGIITLLAKILEHGEKAGIFKHVSPMLVHFMVMGSLMFYKTSAPIRQGRDIFPEIAKTLPAQVAGPIANELETLIINAVKR